MVAAAAEIAIIPEWIVCNASTRSVVDGVVVCPRGIFSPLAHCLECRFLEGAEGDRDSRRTCSVEPTATGSEPQPDSFASWAELIIELL